MNIRTKKIIAKEFLILLLMLSFGIITIICFQFYNNSIENDIEKMENQISKKQKFLNEQEKSSAISKIKQQNRFFGLVESKFDLKDSKYNSRKTLWSAIHNVAEKDSIHYKWNNEWSDELLKFYNRIGYENPEQFKNFIIDNSLNEKELNNYNKIVSERNEIEKIEENKFYIKYRKVDINDSDFLIPLVFLLFIIFFITRYMFYAIKWSFKVLRS